MLSSVPVITGWAGPSGLGSEGRALRRLHWIRTPTNTNALPRTSAIAIIAMVLRSRDTVEPQKAPVKRREPRITATVSIRNRREFRRLTIAHSLAVAEWHRYRL